MEGRVFISYSTADKHIAQRVVDYLEHHGIPCWFAQRDARPGYDFPTQIIDAIEACPNMVFLASSSSFKSEHVFNEIHNAFSSDKTIIPFKIEDVTFGGKFGYYLAARHWIEAHLDMDASLEMLKNAIMAYITTRKETAEIAAVIRAKGRKYLYNPFMELSDEASYAEFESLAQELFAQTLSFFSRIPDGATRRDGDCVGLAVEVLSRGSGRLISVVGRPGSAKNLLLQLVLEKMLANFENGQSNYLPFVFSIGYWDKVLCGRSGDVYAQMREIFVEEFEAYFQYLAAHPEVKPVLLMDGVSNRYLSVVPPEKVVAEIWKPFAPYNRLTAVEVGKEDMWDDGQRIAARILREEENCGFIFKPVPMEDKKACVRFINLVATKLGYQVEGGAVYEILEGYELNCIDIFAVHFGAIVLVTNWGMAAHRMLERYKRLALSDFYGDEDVLNSVAAELYRYVSSGRLDLQSPWYSMNVAGWTMWTSTHYPIFLIAHHIMNCIEHGDYSFLNLVLSSEVGAFLVHSLRGNYPAQDALLHLVVENYNDLGLRQKTNGAFMLGWITYENLASEAVEFLRGEHDQLINIVKDNNQDTQENVDNHLLFRAICDSLIRLEQADLIDEYASIVVGNDIANAVNRGATIEFYGQDYLWNQIDLRDTYSAQPAGEDPYDEDGVRVSHHLQPSPTESIADLEQKHLQDTIEILDGFYELLGTNALMSPFSGLYLIAMLTLLQAGIQRSAAASDFDLRPYVEKSLEYIRDFRTRDPESTHITSDKVMAYLQSVEEDFEGYLRTQSFDIMPVLFNKYNKLKRIKSRCWAQRGTADAESVSEHTFSTWLMAMLFLPEDHPDGYDKREVLDMLLIQNLAEVELAPQGDSSEPTDDLQKQNDAMRRLFLKGSYPDVANLMFYYDLWARYCDGQNINARVARDLDLVQSIYSFCECYCRHPERFTTEEVAASLEKQVDPSTKIGSHLFRRLITENPDFAPLFDPLKETTGEDS
jgi:5'-deoxynucleotidase YfbR-like HD superfamily hydrolase